MEEPTDRDESVPPPRSSQVAAPTAWPFAAALRSKDVRAALRTTMHAVLVGAAVGAVGLGFHALLRGAEHLLLTWLAGYAALAPAGEVAPPSSTAFRPWVLLFLPALGGLGAGALVARFAPETAGGGGDAYVAAFHRAGGVLRRRVAWVKILATTLTLGSGGSAGREGPTMHVGAAVADLFAQRLDLSRRDQRRLLVAGTAAGLTAMFGTPLGAALLATEVLYRDDFESDALIPAILASVTSFALVGTVLPEQRDLFSHAARYDVTLSSLALCVPFVLVLAVSGRLFLSILKGCRRAFRRVERRWMRPAVGGLVLGALTAVVMVFGSPHLGLGQQDVGLFGSGYGAAQVAIVGAPWLPAPAWAALFLGGLALTKMVTTGITLGSGGVGGDFGPSLAIGGLLGGAFGSLCKAFLDPSLDPGLFALVGMGAFYGSLAKVPLASLVMVCELAGTYDLLVPLMMTNVLGSLLLRGASLYRQPATRFDSPLHASEDTLDVLKRVRVVDVVSRDGATLRASSRPAAIRRALETAAETQAVFPLVDDAGKLQGLARRLSLSRAIEDESLAHLVVAHDLAEPAVSVVPADDLHTALERMLDADLPAIAVVDEEGRFVGLLGEHDVGVAYHALLERLHHADPTGTPFPDDRASTLHDPVTRTDPPPGRG